jgi:hypothetical protein
VYPLWANVLGWIIAGSSIAMIPGMAIYKLATTPGTFMQVGELSPPHTRHQTSFHLILGRLIDLFPSVFLKHFGYGMVYSGAGFPLHFDLYVVYCTSPVNFQLSRHTLSAPAQCTAYLPKNSGIQL